MFSLSGEGKNNPFCTYFILVYYYFIFPYLRAFFRPLDIMFVEKISLRQQFFNSHQNWSQIKSSFSLKYAYVSTICYLGEGMAQCSHHCGLGSIHGPDVTCRLSFSLVLFLVPRVFLRVLWFPPSTKTNILNSNSTWKQWTRRANSWNAHC